MDHVLAVRVRERVGDRDHVRQQRRAARERRAARRRPCRASGRRPAASRRTARRRATRPASWTWTIAGMLEARGDPRLALEPARERRDASASSSLIATVAPEPEIARLEHAAHAAARDLARRSRSVAIDGRELRSSRGSSAAIAAKRRSAARIRARLRTRRSLSSGSDARTSHHALHPPCRAAHDGTAAANAASMIGWPPWAMWRLGSALG